MNQSYRVVWQASTNIFRVVPELAKSKGKSTSRKTGRAKMLIRIAAVSLGMLGADAALANAETTEEIGAGSQFRGSCLGPDERTQRHRNADDKNDCKDSTAKINPDSSAVARQEQIATSPTPYASEQAGTRFATPSPAAGIELAAEATGARTTTGSNAMPDAVDSISAGKAGSERQITNLAAGTRDTDAVNLGQVKLLAGDGSSQRYLQVNGKNDGSDNALASGYNAAAIGVQAAATGAGAAALGSQSHALGDYSISSGYGSVARGDNSIASGYSAVANDEAAVAIGKFSTAKSARSVAIGANSMASNVDASAAGAFSSAAGIGASAFGAHALAGGNYSIAAGSNAQALGEASSAFGGDANATAYGSSAIGASARAAGIGSVAVGINANATALESSALGADSVAKAYRSTAVGSQSYAAEDHSAAFGASAAALAINSSAIGAASRAEANNSVALGVDSVADRANSVSVGSAGNQRQIANVAAGTEAGDAINKAQLDAMADSVSSASHYFAVSGNNDGSNNATASGDNSMAAGSSASAVGDGASAFGTSTLAAGTGALALGAGATAVSDPDSDANIAIGANARAMHPAGGGIAIGTDAATQASGIAMGTSALAYGSGSLALGAATVAEGNSSVAIGGSYQFIDGDDPGVIESTTAVGRNSIALGASARANGDNSVAIGPRATASGNGSVALGLLSYADRDNTVSVGNSLTGSTRQITNVQAGTEDYDAVNVQQMNSAVGSLSGSLDSVASILGGGAMMGANGFTSPIFAIQGGNYHTVGDAFGALDGALDSLGNRVSDLESGHTPAAAQDSKPVAKMSREAAPAASGVKAEADSGKDIATQDQIEEVRDYADAGDKQTLSSANQYTDSKMADKVSQSDFNEFKGNVDQRFDKVNKRISRVGAMASAMAGMAGAIAAAPANENRVSAALGGYGGQTALSLGYAKRISNRGALLIGGSIASGGESSGTVGVSFGW